jgi:hypothetical protein
VLNLCTDKGAVLDNAYALLKPGNDTVTVLFLHFQHKAVVSGAIITAVTTALNLIYSR